MSESGKLLQTCEDAFLLVSIFRNTLKKLDFEKFITELEKREGQSSLEYSGYFVLYQTAVMSTVTRSTKPVMATDEGFGE
jgi:hypothetical protein